jgi:uncharacterized cupredoxin-like copper-binding protein
MRPHPTAIGLALTLAAMPLAACGDDEAGSTKPVTIQLRDYTFDGVPRTITAGRPIAATNTSEQEAHELTAFRLPDGEDRPLSELVTLPPDEFGTLLGGDPALAIAARPGEDGELILGDGSLREPGRYVLICFIPTGAEPDDVLTAMKAAAANPDAGPPQIDGGPPHLTAGMIAELTVTP